MATTEGVKELQDTLLEVEQIAEELLLARSQLVHADRLRNGNREALTALRKIARTTKSSVFVDDEAKERCLTCGDIDKATSLEMFLPGSDIFVKLPFHQVHLNLEDEQAELERRVNHLQSTTKEKALQLSEKGAICDRMAPGIVKSLVTLKDKKA